LPVITLTQDPSAFVVSREGDAWRVRGANVEKLASMTVWNLDEAVARFQLALERLGVVDALDEAGVASGDIVRIGDRELVWAD
jgi:GTP-binding protein